MELSPYLLMRYMKPTRNNIKSKGFTLLEVMLVILILTAAFFPLLQQFSAALMASTELKGSNTAILLAQKKIEELKNSTYDSISSEALTTVESNSIYRRRVDVTTPSANLKNIRVIILWNVAEGTTSSVSIETYVSNF
jgi:prepilin-type N-terminal cleavage/methylation domain-containing protein